MKNIEFLKKVLMSGDEYWIVAQENTNNSGRLKDQILFIAIPSEARRELPYEEITLKDLEKLNQMYVNNVYLNVDYPPFQRFIFFHNIYSGFPIKKDIRKTMVDAIAFVSDEIYEYEKKFGSES